MRIDVFDLAGGHPNDYMRPRVGSPNQRTRYPTGRSEHTKPNRAARILASALAIFATPSGTPADGRQPTEGDWPATVPGWKAPEPGEHPRLFFRRWQIPEIRERARTPDGKRIVERLRLLLNGSDGESLPPLYNPSRRATNRSDTPQAVTAAARPSLSGDGAEDEDEEGPATVSLAWLNTGGTSMASSPVHTNVDDLAVGQVYTLWHAAGYGMLWQLTGEKKYADLGRVCVERALDGQRDRDNRYSFIAPHGALRAGPSLGAIAMGYDLCYDGWDEEFRVRVARAIATYSQGPAMSIDELARGARHYPGKNHWGGQVGGGALAALALWKDPGVDPARIERLMATNVPCMIRHLTEGFTDGGFYSEGQGPGGIASDTAFIPALQAWRVAGGKDFVTPRPNASFITVLKAHELILINGKPWYTLRCPSGYGSGNFSPFPVDGMRSDRTGLSRGGQFAQGFGAVDDRYKPALLWVYNRIVEPDPATRTFDTVSPYPHRAALSLVNWPIGMEPVNPENVLRRAHEDRGRGYLVARNQWKDGTDIVVTMKSPLPNIPSPIFVWGLGMKLSVGNSPGPTRPFFKETRDGSVIISNPKGLAYVAVDFSKASGADLLLALIGKEARPEPNVRSPTGASATFHSIAVGGYEGIVLLTVQKGDPPVPRVDGDTIAVGGQTVRFDGRRFHLGRMAEGPPERTFASDFVYSPEVERQVRGEKQRLAQEAEKRRRDALRELDERFARAERLLQAGKTDEARAIAEGVLREYPAGPNAERAARLRRKADERMLEE